MKAYRTKPVLTNDRRRGAAMVEFAIMLPVFLTFMLGILEIAKALQVSGEITSAVREGGRLASMEF